LQIGDIAQEIRRAIYTTNAVDALNRKLREAIITQGRLPSDEAALKLSFLALRHRKKTWGGRHREWCRALAQFAICLEGRIP